MFYRLFKSSVIVDELSINEDGTATFKAYDGSNLTGKIARRGSVAMGSRYYAAHISDDYTLIADKDAA